MKKYFIILIFMFTVFVPTVYAEIANGFILDQIWYSNKALKEGDTVNVYAAVWNGSEYPLLVKVEFYDKNVVLGSREITIPSKKIMDTSVPWKVTSGDHSMSAKIISSTLNMTGGKKETIILEDNITVTDKKFVPVVVKKEEGVSSTSDEIVKDEINKVTDKIEEILPESVGGKVSGGVESLETFRDDTLVKIIEKKKQAEEKILEYKDFANGTKEENLESATERPIAQVKLFFLKVLKIIFSSKIIFYGLLIFMVFYILRGIYYQIRNR